MKQTKKSMAIVLFALMLLSPNFLMAKNKWNTTKGWFHYQKDIDKTVSDYSNRAAIVNYQGKLLHFISYIKFPSHCKIIIRELENTKTDGISWKSKKYDDIANLKKLDSHNWQPAPVVFEGMLYLFVLENGEVCYYQNSGEGIDKWAKKGVVPLSLSSNMTELSMAAVIVDDKLCLTVVDDKNHEVVWVTKDFTTWEKHDINISVGLDYDSFIGETAGPYAISVLSKNYMDGDTLRNKLMVGYINHDETAYVAEFKFNNNNNNELEMIANLMINDADDVTSIALAEGSVKDDPSSKGICTQAFLRKKKIEKGYQRHRIKRWQKIEGASSWTEPESNIVPQNSPHRLWADKVLNLTAANFAINSGNDINQYMCLIYRGYDDWDHPLNCAWAQTDTYKFVADPEHPGQPHRTTLNDSKNVLYVGYIEGVPPYYLNNVAEHGEVYVNEEAKSISEVAHEIINSTTTSTEYVVSGTITQKSKGAGFKEELSQAYQHKWGNETSYTVTHSLEFHASEKQIGKYLTNQPVINRADYAVYDVHNNYLFTTYYFWVSKPNAHVETVDLPSYLTPCKPETYMNRSFELYDSYTADGGPETVSWSESTNSSAKVTVGKGKSSTNATQTKIKFEAGPKIFNIAIKGEFEWGMTAETKTEQTISCATRLNNAGDDPNDIVSLDYNFYWLKPTVGQNNWWFHPGQDETQDTWCVTYNVTYVEYVGGEVKGVQSPSKSSPTAIAEKETQVGTYLAQNYPNPFTGSTTLSYQVSDNQGLGYKGLTQLAIYNVMGKQVALLVNQEQMPGTYEIEWDATDLPAGTYFGALQSGSKKEVIKLILLK